MQGDPSRAVTGRDLGPSPAAPAALSTGFAGISAGFQPGLRPFLARHAGLLTGLSVCDDPAELIRSVANARPDYVVLAASDRPAGLLAALIEAVRTPPLGVLIADDEGAVNGDLHGGAVADHVAAADKPGDVALILRALMRRCRPHAMAGRAAYGDLLLDEACLTFAIGGRTVPLNLEVFGVLGAMMDDPTRVWERERLHALVFGRGSRNDIRAIDMRISRARRHVTAVLGRDPIQTVRGVGYALVPEP